MIYNFQNKVALVTGGASGIGRAVVLRYAEAGAKVVVSDRDVAGGEKVVNLINEQGGNAIFIATDVSNEMQVSNMIKTTIATFGRLDIAFNNAGVAKPSLLTDVIEEDWNRMIDINLKGVWLCMKYEIPELLKQSSPVIINAASMAGLVGTKMVGVYSAAKAGVIALTKCSALDYAKSGLRINAICPGVIDTPFLGTAENLVAEISQTIPMGKLGSAEDIANAVIWLSSEQSSYMTGQPMVVDGGFTVP